MKHVIKLIFIIPILMGIISCTGNLNTIEIETPELQLSAEGPLFEGANSATSTWEFNLGEILGNDEAKVAQAKVTSVKVILKGADELPALEKMVFEITSKNTSMTRIGLYEEGIREGQAFFLNIADKQENLASAFADGKMTFVGDFDLVDEEYWGNVEFTLQVKFELGIK